MKELVDILREALQKVRQLQKKTKCIRVKKRAIDAECELLAEIWDIESKVPH